jgi:hypothetical protein
MQIFSQIDVDGPRHTRRNMAAGAAVVSKLNRPDRKGSMFSGSV